MSNQSPSTRDRERLDKRVVSTGLAESRQKAQSLILSGAVLVNGQKMDKAGALIPMDSDIILKDAALPYHGMQFVGRGGLKLESALQAFSLDVNGMVVLDVGASTGGFADCLLQRGAKRVYAVDVGYGQLAWRIRQDPRVVNLERTHILRLPPAKIPEAVDLITMDLSFISLTYVLAKALEFLKLTGTILPLVKPQFEVGKGEVGKGGIVRDPMKRLQAVERIKDFSERIFLRCEGVFESPVHGQDGNIEYFLCLKFMEESREGTD